MTQVTIPENSQDDVPFHIDPTALYSQKFILKKFGMAKKTLSAWHSQGLRQFRPGTLKAHYLGAHLLKFVDNIASSDGATIDRE